MKRKAKELTKDERIRTLDALYTAASSVKGRDAVKLFLRDLLTESERIMLGRRVLIARMLLAGQGYNDIAEELKVGKDTISKVDRWLQDQAPGYETAIAGLKKEYERRVEKKEWRKAYADQSWSGLIALYKKKYPLDFLLFPWPKGYGPKWRKKEAAKL